MSRPYFTPESSAREVAWWAVAARLALDEWEPLVADNVRSDGGLEGLRTWESQRWHHAAVLAAAHVFTASDMLDPPLEVDASLRNDIKAGRDLLEHWDQNRPVFQVRPRRERPPRASGRGFAERHPRHGPYFALGWEGGRGPMLLPEVPAAAVHALLDHALLRALAVNPRLADYVPARRPSPWIENPQEQGWWPRKAPA